LKLSKITNSTILMNYRLRFVVINYAASGLQNYNSFSVYKLSFYVYFYFIF